MQDVDAERRMQVLRGLKVDKPPAPPNEPADEGRRRRDGAGRERKRRRITGEDDTDRDIRFAQDKNALVPAKPDLQLKSVKNDNAPITDHRGHINLFPSEDLKRNAPKNAEVEAEKAKKQKEFEDQYTMRFSNAAGFKQAIGQKPWYSSLDVKGSDGAEAPSKDVWGNEDPRRKEREKVRMSTDDPLAAIKKGVAGVREVDKERNKWREERAQELQELEEAEKRRARRRRKRRQMDDLEGFSLDDTMKSEHRERHRRRSRDPSSRQSNRHRSRSRDREHYRHHHKGLDERNKPGWEVGPGGRYSAQFAHK